MGYVGYPKQDWDMRQAGSGRSWVFISWQSTRNLLLNLPRAVGEAQPKIDKVSAKHAAR